MIFFLFSLLRAICTVTSISTTGNGCDDFGFCISGQVIIRSAARYQKNACLAQSKALRPMGEVEFEVRFRLQASCPVAAVSHGTADWLIVEANIVRTGTMMGWHCDWQMMTLQFLWYILGGPSPHFVIAAE